MKKFLLIFLMGAMLAGLTVTASRAAPLPPNNCQPGCACTKTATGGMPGPSGGPGPNGTNNYGGFFGLQENRANAIELRDRTYDRQLTHQNDNALGMTCFDHTLALSSRLGQIFSDKMPPSNFPVQNSKVFGTSTYPGFGSDQMLSTALGYVVGPPLQKHADDFGDSLSQILGAANLSYLILGSGFMNSINSVISSIQGVITQINSAVQNLNTMMGYIQQIITLLNGQTPTYILAIVTAITAAWGAIQGALTSVIQGFQSAIVGTINSFINDVTNGIMGLAGSLSGFLTGSATEGGPCARIQNLWGTGAAAGGFPAAFMTGVKRALSGSGIQTGAPYFSFSDMLTKTPIGTIAAGSVGGDIQDELANPSNSTLINRASQDLTNALSGPGVLPALWPSPPSGGVLTPGATAASIIGAMP